MSRSSGQLNLVLKPIADAIVRLREGGYSQNEIAKRLNVRVNVVRDVIRYKKSFGWEDPGPNEALLGRMK